MMIMLPRPRHRHRVHGAPGTAAHGNGGPRRVAANAAPPSSPRGSRAQPGRRRSGACTAAASSSTVIATASATAISSTAAFPYEDWLREAGDGMDILPHPLFGPSAYARRAFKAGEVVLHERPLLVVPSPPVGVCVWGGRGAGCGRPQTYPVPGHWTRAVACMGSAHARLLTRCMLWRICTRTADGRACTALLML